MYRSWIGTYNNPTVRTAEWLELLFTKLKAKYVVGQTEMGE